MSEVKDDNQTTEKLYANKFKTIEDLENGYRNSLPTFQENENLKKELEKLKQIPDQYLTPSDIALHDSDLEVVRNEAKNSGLTQSQYEKLVRQRYDRSVSKHQSFEQAKKEMGADNLNLIQDYLSKTYSQKSAELLLKEAIRNKEVREEILAARTQMLNSSVPGSNRVSVAPSYSITEKDVLKARDEMNAARGRNRVEAQNRYIALQAQRAHAKNA